MIGKVFGFLCLYSTLGLSAAMAAEVTEADNMLRLPEHTRLVVQKNFPLATGDVTWFRNGKVAPSGPLGSGQTYFPETVCYLFHVGGTKPPMSKGEFLELGFQISTQGVLFKSELISKIAISNHSYVMRVGCIRPESRNDLGQVSIGEMRKILAPWLSVEIPR